MKYLEMIKTKVKSTITIMSYMAGIGLLVYAITFAIKKRNNGNNIAVNVLIGLIDGIVQALNFTLVKWFDQMTPIKK